MACSNVVDDSGPSVSAETIAVAPILVPPQTLAYLQAVIFEVSPHSPGVDNDVFGAEEDLAVTCSARHGPVIGEVSELWDVIEEQAVVRPVKVPLNVIRDPDFRGNKVIQ